jgi:hypothetical protein
MIERLVAILANAALLAAVAHVTVFATSDTARASG